MDASLIEFRLKEHDDKFSVFERRYDESRKIHHDFRSLLMTDSHSIRDLIEIGDRNFKSITLLNERMEASKIDINELKNEKKIEQGIDDKFFKFIQFGKIVMPVLIFVLVILQGFDIYKVTTNSNILSRNATIVKSILSESSK